MERPITNRGDRIGNRYARKAGAIIERIVTNRGDRIGNRYACKAIAISKRILTNRGDGITVYNGWNFHIGLFARVPCNGGGFVCFIIGVNEAIVLFLRGECKYDRPHGYTDEASDATA